MNANNAKDYLPLVQALAEGRTIQERHDLDDPWVDAINPVFDWHYGDYRIKPEPKEIWITEYPNGEVFFHPSEESARVGRSQPTGVTRRYREVIE